ncbi:MAG: hypothetical protein QOJ96_12, partial [Alphaproteobacteria bacterium]|nr:hypothetical protein [Alphaproteobacteria bacterium]
FLIVASLKRMHDRASVKAEPT